MIVLSPEQAAGIYEHYIRLALQSAGLTITPDMDRELREATIGLSAPLHQREDKQP